MKVGDLVATRSGRIYRLDGLDGTARLSPLLPGPRRRRTAAQTRHLTLVRSMELETFRIELGRAERAEALQRSKHLAHALRWLNRAIERNDDCRHALDTAARDLEEAPR